MPIDDVDGLVAERLRRNELMNPVRRWELIHTEGALTWCLGGPTTMVEQMDHLLVASERPTVDLGIVPAFTPVPFYAHHGFSIHDADVVNIGTRSGTALLSDSDDIVEYAELFTQLPQAAVHGDEARALLVALRAEYRARM